MNRNTIVKLLVGRGIFAKSPFWRGVITSLALSVASTLQASTVASVSSDTNFLDKVVSSLGTVSTGYFDVCVPEGHQVEITIITGNRAGTGTGGTYLVIDGEKTPNMASGIEMSWTISKSCIVEVGISRDLRAKYSLYFKYSEINIKKPVSLSITGDDTLGSSPQTYGFRVSYSDFTTQRSDMVIVFGGNVKWWVESGGDCVSLSSVKTTIGAYEIERANVSATPSGKTGKFVLCVSYTENGVTVIGRKTVEAGTSSGVALESISITGDVEVAAEGTARYGCIAKMSDGTSKSVSPVWSFSVNQYADFSTDTGILSAHNASASWQTVRIKALYTENGTMKSATQQVAIAPSETPPQSSVVSIAVFGASALQSGGNVRYTCTATMSDGTAKTVIPEWSFVAPEEISSAAMTDDGQFQAVNASQHEVEVCIHAEYHVDGVLLAADMYVTVGVAQMPSVELSRISIFGELFLESGWSDTYLCTAIYSDGTAVEVVPNWQVAEGAEYATINSLGVLSVYNDSGTMQLVKIRAEYGGKTETFIVSVSSENVQPPDPPQPPATPQPVSIAISGPSSVAADSFAQYTCILEIGDGMTVEVSPEWQVEYGNDVCEIGDGGGFRTFNENEYGIDVDIIADYVLDEKVFHAVMTVSIGAAVVDAQFELEDRVEHTYAEGEGKAWICGSGRWSLSSSEDWLVVHEPSGRDSSSFEYSFSRNDGAQPRTATLELWHDQRLLDTMVVVQDCAGGADFFELDKATWSTSFFGAGAAEVSIKSTLPWKATSDVDWIELLQGEGTGDGLLKFSVGESFSREGRDATIVVSAQDMRMELVVSQYGIPDDCALVRWFSWNTNEIACCKREMFDVGSALTGEYLDSSIMPVWIVEAKRKEGLVFDGWWTKPDGGRQLFEGEILEGDLDVYAHWVHKRVVFTFIDFFEEEGWWDETVLEFAFGDTVVPPVFTREGYVFAGWSSQVPEIVAWDTDSAFFTAKWTKLHSVEFGWSDKEYEWHGIALRDVPEGVEIGDLPPFPECDGYGFDNWFRYVEIYGWDLFWDPATEDWIYDYGCVGYETVPVDEKTVVNEDMTVYAAWTKIHRIEFDVAGGVVDEPIRMVRDKTPLGEPPVPVFDGYVFTGWSTYPDGGSSYNKDARAWADLTFYAQWSLGVDVFLDANGGELSTNRFFVVANTSVDTLEIPVRDGYAFIGWFMEAFGGKKVDGKTKVVAGCTYHAHWRYVGAADEKTIVFVIESGYETVVDGTFALNVLERVGSLSMPKITVKGLPAGLKFDAATGVISGKATKPGVYVVTLSVTNATVKKPVTATFELKVPNLVDDEIPVADEYGPYIPGKAYVATITNTASCTVTGLPTGMKWTAKDIVDSKTKLVTVPANSVYGAATKPGNYTVYFTKTVKETNEKGKQVSVKHTATATFVVGPFPKLTIDVVGTGTGKVTGAGEYAANKKVTLKATVDTKDAAATATKPATVKSVFIGWYDGEALLSQSASYSLVMPETDVVLTAKFATADEDKASISLVVDGEELSSAPAFTPTKTNFCGVAMNWPLAATALSATTIKVSGLPSGLKFTAKDILKKGSKTEVEIPANTIYGAPTAASKVDRNGNVTPSKVVFTVTTAGKSTQTFAINLYIDPLPAWATGNFNGEVSGGRGATALPDDGDGRCAEETRSVSEGRFAEGEPEGCASIRAGSPLPAASGTVALTIDAKGKISGKALADGLTYTLAAPYYSGFAVLDDGGEGLSSNFLADVTASWSYKEGTKTIKTNEVVQMSVQDNGVGGVVRSGAAAWGHAALPDDGGQGLAALPDDGHAGRVTLPEWTAWQYNWKVDPWKDVGKKFDKQVQVYAICADGSFIDDDEAATVALGADVTARVTLKFAASGTVSVAGEFAMYDETKDRYTTVKASGSATLVPVDDDHGEVFIYLTPKGLDPHARCLDIAWPEE